MTQWNNGIAFEEWHYENDKGYKAEESDDD
jgi:hypothetical protein